MGSRQPARPCPAGDAAPGAITRCEIAATVPADARVTAPTGTARAKPAAIRSRTDAPFGLPFRPTPFTARIALEFAGEPAVVEVPVVHRYEGNIFSGEKRMELHVVPAITVDVSPGIAVVPVTGGVRPDAAGPGDLPTGARELTVTVTNNAPEPAEALVRFEAPHGWRVGAGVPQPCAAPRDEAATVSFRMAPPAGRAARRARGRGGSRVGRHAVRSRRAGDRVPAHAATARRGAAARG
jgi:hypothetical protein